MAFSFRAESSIDAPPETVWSVLTNTQAWHEWNGFLSLEGGTLSMDGTPALRLTMEGAPSYVFKPKMLAFEPGRHLAWVGRTGPKGVFDGEHHFRLTPEGNGAHLVNEETFSGLLSPVMRRLPMLAGAQAGFEQMNAQIKARAERIGRADP